MLSYPEHAHIAFDLEPITKCKAIWPCFHLPCRRSINDLERCICYGYSVALITQCVDDEAQIARKIIENFPNEEKLEWYLRIGHDMKIRVLISQWCLEHLGFVLPLSNQYHNSAIAVYPIKPDLIFH